MDRWLHSPSRSGVLLHRESLETLLCDSQYAQLVRATAFERGRCFAFCFLALICSLQVSANGGNMKTMYVGIWGISLLHLVNTAKWRTKNTRNHSLSSSMLVNPTLLHGFVQRIREQRIVHDFEEHIKLKQHVQDSKPHWSEVNVELHAVLHCAESVAAIWMANAFGSGVPALWEEHGFALRLFLASSVIQWPLLVILRCFCSHQLPSHDFVAVTKFCLSEEAESICDSCDSKIPLYVAATVPFTMKSGCDVAKLVDLMMKGQESSQVAAQTCDLIKRHVLPKKSSELPADVTAASCMQAVLCAMNAHLPSPEVQEQAVWCLKNLALNRPENEETLMTLGGAAAILRAMTENCSNEAVQKEGCVALAKLTTEHQNVLRFLSLEADQVILAALRNYTTSTGVQWWAFQALGNLAESREGRAKLRDLLAADVINAAMSSGNSEIQQKGQLLLDKLGQVGHTGPWDVTLSCCAEASPVCKDRRGFGRGWVRWWFCALAFIFFMLTFGVNGPNLYWWRWPVLRDSKCSMVQHGAAYASHSMVGSLDIWLCCSQFEEHGTTNYRSLP